MPPPDRPPRGPAPDRAAPEPFGVAVVAALLRTGLVPPSAEGLEPLAACFERVALPAGVQVFAQGDEGDGWYLILAGAVAVVQGGGPGVEGEVIDQLEAGESFGEMALIDGAPRMAAAEVVEAAVLARLPRGAFDARVAAGDPAAVALLRGMAGVLCRRHRQLVSVLHDLVGAPDEPPDPSLPLWGLVKASATWN
jgi:CRP-like cAMP-binding protein